VVEGEEGGRLEKEEEGRKLGEIEGHFDLPS